ncbi:MAG: putative Ig domain-containing protein [Acidobacteria bacterium]|nr:putative Ig domain-containing protein [Acidobacteriota bacterium]
MAEHTVNLGAPQSLGTGWCFWGTPSNNTIPAVLVAGSSARRLVSVSLNQGTLELSLVDDRGNAVAFSQAVQDSPRALTFIVGTDEIVVPGPDAGSESGSFSQYTPPNSVAVALNAFCVAHPDPATWQLKISDVSGPVDLRAEAATALGASISLPANARAYVDPQRADAATGLASSIALPASATARIRPVLRAEAGTGLVATISLPVAAEGSRITAATLRAGAATPLAAATDFGTSATAHLQPQIADAGTRLAATISLPPSARGHIDAATLQARSASALGLHAALPPSALAEYEAQALTFPAIGDRTFIVGETIDITLPRARGGIFIYDYSATLPSWLSLISEGIVHKITGVAPNIGQDLAVTVTVESGGATVSRDFRIVVTVEDTSPAFPPFRNPTFVVGVDVHEVLPMANGGNGTLTYFLIGSLPPGLAFDRGSRALTGNPTRAGVYTLTYRVGDADDYTHEQKLTITVASAMSGSPLVLPPAGDRIFFVGDDIDETLPAPYGGRGPFSYSITPAIGVTDSERLGESPADVGVPPVLASIRRVRGEFRNAGKTTHVIVVTDADGLRREEDITIDVRRLDRDTGRPAQGRQFIEARIAFFVPEAGERRGFAYVSDELRSNYQDADGVVSTNAEGKIVVDGQAYEIGEVVGLGRYEIELSSSRPLPVELEGSDPVFRAWLEYGGSTRDVEVRFLLKLPPEGGGNPRWEVAFKIVGRVGRVVESGENYLLDVDSEVYIPSQQGVSRWSDEDQQETFPGDRFWSQLTALARGHVLTWPGTWLVLALSNILVRYSSSAL